MAHFAEVDAQGLVLRVIVVDNSLERNGAEWCSQTFGGEWVQTSYNGTIRKNFAGVGYRLDRTLDAFIAPQPFPSWALNEASCRWEPPVPMPDDGKAHTWNEAALAWD